MQRAPSRFDDYFRSHLPREQRRAVLEVLANELDPGTTIGEVIDAAEEIGWGDELGALDLAELAGVLVGEVVDEGAMVEVVGDDGGEDDADTAENDEVDEVAAEDADGADDEDEDDGDVVALTAKAKKTAKKKATKKAAVKKTAAAKKTAKKAAAKKTAKKAAAKKTAAKSKKTAKSKKAAKSKTTAKSKKTAKSTKTAKSKKTTKSTKTAKSKTTAKAKAKKTAAKSKTTKTTAKAKSKKTSARASKAVVDDDEALSLEQAAKLLVPIVRRLKEATMQELEEKTGMGRRKLRFHIGQLVKHERLTRHGMGRGTYYTAAKR